MESRLRIAEQLLDEGDIKAGQFRAWSLHVDGHSDRQIAKVLHHRRGTCRIWWEQVDYLVERVERGEERDGKARAGVTIHRSGAGATETPVAIDPVLKALGF